MSKVADRMFVQLERSVLIRRAVHIEFLDYLLRHKENDRKLEQSLFSVLSIPSMIGVLRRTCVMLIAKSDQMMWLSVQTH